MTIRIVTDSTCDLPGEAAAAAGITVVPMLVKVGSQEYRDGIDLGRRVFYEQLSTYQPYPTTAVPGAEIFTQVYRQLAAEGASQILSIHIMAGLSTVPEVARTAAQAVTGAEVIVLDSRSISLGAGFQALRAAHMAAEGRSLAEILAALQSQAQRTHVVALLDVLEYLQRSGRMHSAVAGLGQLLRFKPLVKIHNGESAAEGVRTRERATERLVQVLNEIGPLEQAGIIHSNAPDRVDDLLHKAGPLLPPGEIPVVDITPVIGVHTGPNAVGFACVAIG